MSEEAWEEGMRQTETEVFPYFFPLKRVAVGEVILGVQDEEGAKVTFIFCEGNIW